MQKFFKAFLVSYIFICLSGCCSTVLILSNLTSKAEPRLCFVNFESNPSDIQCHVKAPRESFNITTPAEKYFIADESPLEITCKYNGRVIKKIIKSETKWGGADTMVPNYSYPNVFINLME